MRRIPLWLIWALCGAPVLAEAAVFRLVRSLHDRVFLGEFGFFELGTVIFALSASVLAGSAVIQIIRLRRQSFAATSEPKAPPEWTEKLSIALLVLLALGSFYFAAEEVSWGQHLLGWETPSGWAESNRQQETTLHNIRVLVPITNMIPRFLLQLAAAACLVFVIRDAVSRTRSHAREVIRFFWPPPETAPIAVFALLSPLPRFIWGREIFDNAGEVEEFYLAALLAVFTAALWRRSRNSL